MYDPQQPGSGAGRVEPPKPPRESDEVGDGAEGPPEGSWVVARLKSAVEAFDRQAERPFVALRGNKVADRFFYGASEAANFSMLWHAMAWTPVVLRPTRHRVMRALGTSGALAAESVVVNGPVKSVFGRSRPVLHDGQTRPHRLRTPRSTSFPSGHASAALVAALVMGRGRAPAARWSLLALASAVSASRVHVRIHHPSDVLGGAAVGVVLGRLLRRVLP